MSSNDPKQTTTATQEVVGRPVSWWRKVAKEWSTWFIGVGLIVQAAPELVPHIENLLSPVLGDYRSLVSSALLLAGIVVRFIPQTVKISVQQEIEEAQKPKSGEGGS